LHLLLPQKVVYFVLRKASEMNKKIGRPALRVDLRKDNVIRIRVSQRELDAIKKLAKAKGVTITGLVRGKVLGDADDR
jgi:predicted DNA binding CopG/RHH family protein